MQIYLWHKYIDLQASYRADPYWVFQFKGACKPLGMVWDTSKKNQILWLKKVMIQQGVAFPPWQMWRAPQEILDPIIFSSNNFSNSPLFSKGEGYLHGILSSSTKKSDSSLHFCNIIRRYRQVSLHFTLGWVSHGCKISADEDSAKRSFCSREMAQSGNTSWAGNGSGRYSGDQAVFASEPSAHLVHNSWTVAHSLG